MSYILKSMHGHIEKRGHLDFWDLFAGYGGASEGALDAYPECGVVSVDASPAAVTFLKLYYERKRKSHEAHEKILGDNELEYEMDYAQHDRPDGWNKGMGREELKKWLLQSFRDRLAKRGCEREDVWRHVQTRADLKVHPRRRAWRARAWRGDKEHSPTTQVHASPPCNLLCQIGKFGMSLDHADSDTIKAVHLLRLITEVLDELIDSGELDSATVENVQEAGLKWHFRNLDDCTEYRNRSQRRRGLV